MAYLKDFANEAFRILQSQKLPFLLSSMAKFTDDKTKTESLIFMVSSVANSKRASQVWTDKGYVALHNGTTTFSANEGCNLFIEITTENETHPSKLPLRVFSKTTSIREICLNDIHVFRNLEGATHFDLNVYLEEKVDLTHDNTSAELIKILTVPSSNLLSCSRACRDSKCGVRSTNQKKISFQRAFQSTAKCSGTHESELGSQQFVVNEINADSETTDSSVTPNKGWSYMMLNNSYAHLAIFKFLYTV